MEPALRRRRQPRARFLLTGAFVLALGACTGSPPPHSEPETVVSADETTFDTDQQAWRDERRASLLAPDGWASLTGLHWIGEGAHYIGANAGNGIQLLIGPAHLGMIERRGQSIRFVPHVGGDLTLDGAELTDATALRSDDLEGGPGVLGFDGGRGEATVILRSGRYALRVRHVDAPTRTGFTALDYWPPEQAWVVTGRFIAHPPGKTVEIGNIVGGVDAMPNPGAVEFQRDGQDYRLEAIDDGSGQLFLIFADRTNGQGSYGAGRFLYAPMADANGRVLLDFNRAYSPPCAFTDFATCPLPPPENRLDLAVTAGEKNYVAAR